MKRRPIKRTLAQWRAIKVPKPPPEPTYTEKEYLAIEEANKPPFYQLKAEFPDITYEDGTSVYTINGHRLKRGMLDGVDSLGNMVISLCPEGEYGFPSIRYKTDWESYLTWWRRSHADQPSRPNRSWLQRLLS